MRHAFCVVVIIVGFCMGCHSSAQTDAKIPVGDATLHIVCSGEGSPVVVLDAGLGNDARAWSTVQPDVARTTRVCAYDRAGMGLSSPAKYPHRNAKMAEELHGLLTKSKEPPPYVLVGHSMGGTNVRLFASKYPSSVAGMVLVDSAPMAPPFELIPPKEVAEFEKNIRAMEGLDIATMRAAFDELDRANTSLGNKPLLILIAGRADPAPFLDEAQAHEIFLTRQKAQREMTKLSTNSVAMTIENSAHHMPHDAPQAISKAVQTVVEAVRNGGSIGDAMSK